jgi:hypothetical protein
MTDHKYADLAAKQEGLIRKALDGSAFMADYSAAAVTSITADSSGSPGTPTLKPLVAGYTDVGLLDASGTVFSNEISTNDITSWGRVQPSRRDIITDVDSIHIIMQETKLQTIAAYAGVDTSLVDVADATTGEVGFNKSTSPVITYRKLFCLAVDNPGSSEEIYLARFYPRVALASKGDQGYVSDNTAGIVWDTTWTGFIDDTLGYACRYMFGGPGWQALLTEMGFS